MSDTQDDAPLHHPFVLGIIGDSGSGKSTVSRGVRELIGADRVSTLELDDYHRYSRAERLELQLTALNPMVHNLSLMQEHLQLLRRGRPVRNRSYDHTDGTFGPPHTLEPQEVVVVRGLLGFPTEELRACYDLTVFLYPEPDLLFRWKLRRDTKSRGYSEAEVLKSIARHLLDSKIYVLPQADRADLVVRYEVPDWDAPDTQVRTSLLLRRAAADAVRQNGVHGRFGEHVRFEEQDDGGGLVIHIDNTLPAELVDAWGADLFPETYGNARFGLYQDEEGGEGRLVPLA
ncbi:MAG TPA: hypothetical protein VK358_04535, partial [Longimicrobium sp.]|nr:hypothetical protein [Longimicrobium sp.]